MRVYCALGKVREGVGVLEMMLRGAQAVDGAAYESLAEAAWCTGALPLQRYALAALAGGRARGALVAAAAGDDHPARDRTLLLRVPRAPPHVAALALLQLLRALQRGLAASGGGGVLRPVARVVVELQVRGAAGFTILFPSVPAPAAMKSVCASASAPVRCKPRLARPLGAR